MSSRLLRSSLAASLMALLAAVSIPAEAAQVRCRIPFSFTVHGATLPPGNYHASTDVGPGMLAIHGDRSFAFAIANDLLTRDESEARLVFYKYGDSYYLREVWLGGRSGRELPQNHPKGDVKTAKDGTAPEAFERVVIAAR